LLVIGLNGSPNKDGNTAYLVNLALETAHREGAETELVHVEEILASQKYPYCRACASPCPGSCYRGTALETTYRRLAEASAVIAGSPVYFGTVSGQLKGFWDKTRKLRAAMALLNTVGAAVTVGASRFGGQETVLHAIYDMMLVHGMILVGDGHHTADCGHLGACAHRPAAGDRDALQRVQVLARRVVEVARVTAPLKRGKPFII
jgi:multimeric flavodoxin WrbA